MSLVCLRPGGFLRRQSFRHALVAVAACVLSGSIVRASAIASTSVGCPTSSFVIDPSLADTTLVAFFGKAWGQVVAVQDTIVSAVTVWMPPMRGSFGLSMQLFVCQVDSSGFAVPGLLVLTGPTIDGEAGDGINSTPCRIALSPPAMLPGKGRYCFAVKENTCGEAFTLLAESHPVSTLGAFEFGP